MRQSIGLQYPQMTNNNVRQTTSYRRVGVATHKKPDDMTGEGIMDIARTVLDVGKKGAKMIYDNRESIGKAATMAKDIYTSETGTALRNLIPSSDKTARDGFAGEKHAILKLKNGKNGIANFMGPDTAILERLKRGDPGRTAVDTISKAHDIRYALATKMSDIRDADNKMLKAVEVVEKNKLDKPRNIKLAKLIALKKAGEDFGLIKKNAFSGDIENRKISAEDKKIFEKELAPLAQHGMGMLPGEALKAKLMKQMKRKKKGKKGGSIAMPTYASKSKTMPSSSNYKMIGKGNPLQFTKDKITKFVSGSVMPLLMKSVGLPPDMIKKAKIASTISKALALAKDGNLNTIIQHLVKVILPLLTKAKIEQLKKKGSGYNLAGSGVSKSIGNAASKLSLSLGKVLLSAFKAFINQGAKARGQSPVFGGSGKGKKPKKKDGHFWKSFAKGFTSVFKPFATVAGPVLDMVGLPEFGMPLSAVGALM